MYDLAHASPPNNTKTRLKKINKQPQVHIVQARFYTMVMPKLDQPKLHIAMFPWIGMGHLTPFIHIGNQLAMRGHRISVLIPPKASVQLANNNLVPDLVKYHVVTVPSVKGLPEGAETTADIEYSENNALAIAFDAMAGEVEQILAGLKPDVVMFDLADWIPQIAARVGFKTVAYNIVSASCCAITVVPARVIPTDRPMTDEELVEPPKGYPSDTVVFRLKEARAVSFIANDYGDRKFHIRAAAAFRDCDAIGIRTCKELEGPACDYLSSQYGKPVILSGPALQEPPKGRLEEKWETWLAKFEPKSVVYCSFGSQTYLTKPQFQEMLLAFENTNLPFFIAVAKPFGANSIEEAIPDGFFDRVGDRGIVYGGWVQQTRFLSHPKVGCFVSHGGFGSTWESLLSDVQIVMIPRLPDQILNTRILVEELKVAVEVETGDMGWFSKESLCKSIKSVMDKDSELADLLRKNHAERKEIFAVPGFMDNYIDNYVQDLYQL